MPYTTDDTGARHYTEEPARAEQAARLITAAHGYSGMRVSVETMRRRFDSVQPGMVLITYVVWDDDGEESVVETVQLGQGEWNAMLADALRNAV